ncbi:hypothetical protein J7K50_01320 [bacterium]|nr:hypothetical protein [bacterium]
MFSKKELEKIVDKLSLQLKDLIDGDTPVHMGSAQRGLRICPAFASGFDVRDNLVRNVRDEIIKAENLSMMACHKPFDYESCSESNDYNLDACDEEEDGFQARATYDVCASGPSVVCPDDFRCDATPRFNCGGKFNGCQGTYKDHSITGCPNRGAMDHFECDYTGGRFQCKSFTACGSTQFDGCSNLFSCIEDAFSGQSGQCGGASGEFACINSYTCEAAIPAFNCNAPNEDFRCGTHSGIGGNFDCASKYQGCGPGNGPENCPDEAEYDCYIGIFNCSGIYDENY